jgi:hypothetical protein
MSQVSAWFRLTLLAVAVLGGLHGIVICLEALFSPTSQGLRAFILFGAMLAAYIYVTAAGLIYWRRPNQMRPLAWALTIQIPWISLPGFVYKFSAGLSVCVALIATRHRDMGSVGVNGNFKLGSSCELRLLQDAPIELGLNVAALAALFVLNRAISSTECDFHTGLTDERLDQVLQSRNDKLS